MSTDPIGNGNTDTIYRLREGIERFLITDINNPAASSKAQSEIFVLCMTHCPVWLNILIMFLVVVMCCLWMDMWNLFVILAKRLFRKVWHCFSAQWLTEEGMRIKNIK
jgi:hypothetical protein